MYNRLRGKHGCPSMGLFLEASAIKHDCEYTFIATRETDNLDDWTKAD